MHSAYNTEVTEEWKSHHSHRKQLTISIQFQYIYIYIVDKPWPRSDIPPAVEEVYGDIPRGPQAQGVYPHKPPNTSRWYITHILRLDMVHILCTKS